MSANTQTLSGPASKPSAERADTTSTKTGGKRKRPVSASDVAPNGGADWTVEEGRRLWSYRWQQGFAGYKEMGTIFGRSAQACRLAVHKLLAVYRDKGYEDTFGQQRPAGLMEPPPPKEKNNAAKPVAKKKESTRPSKAGKARIAAEGPASADGASETGAIGLAKEEMTGLSEAENDRRTLAKMNSASRKLRKRAHREAQAQAQVEAEAEAEADEAAERMARESAQFRTADGHRYYVAGFENNKTTTFADPETQARVEKQCGSMQRYYEPVPARVDPRDLDAAAALLRLAEGTGARLSLNPQFAAERRSQQDPRMSLSRVVSDD